MLIIVFWFVMIIILAEYFILNGFYFSPFKEHKGESSNKTDSAIHEHQLATSHKIDFDNVKIIDRADSDCQLQFKEILQIDKKKPLLNIKFNSSVLIESKFILSAQGRKSS